MRPEPITPLIDPVRLWAMARKEWTQLRRDRRSMALAFLLPVLLLVFFGYAINWDIDDIRVAALDMEKSRTSRDLLEAFQASGYFTVEEHLDSYAQAEARLVDGDVLGVLVIPPDLSQQLAGARGARVQLLLDGSDANTATIALNYADAMAARISSQGVLRGRELRLAVEPEVRVWYNATLESRNMIVPALVAVIMSIIAAMLTSLTIAREWERGTMEQLASTPVSRLEVVLGKLLPYLIIGLVDVAVTVAVGITLFGAPLRGSVLLLGAMTLLFLLGALGLGIFISAAVKSQVLAIQIALITTYLPAVLLSGFLFDIAGMPLAVQGVTYLVPARYFITVTRGIFMKGVGIDVLWTQALFMLAFAVVGLAAAARAFRKELA